MATTTMKFIGTGKFVAETENTSSNLYLKQTSDLS